jgi:hypothetical protein
LDLGRLYSATNTRVLVDRIAGSALYAYALKDDFNTYGYVTAAHDPSIQLASRYTLGFGACRHKLLSDAFSLLLISFNPALERNNYLDGGMAEWWRAVFRVTGIKPLGGPFELGFDGFYTPVIDQPANTRLYGEVSLKVKLVGEILAWRLTAADGYDSSPPAGILNNDMGIFTSLETAWGN